MSSENSVQSVAASAVPPQEIYEGCTTRLRTWRPDILDHLLEIEFIHVPTKRLLKRARFFVNADDRMAAWIKSHPTFSRGCWPLGLINLRDWMWKIKFVEVSAGKVQVEEGGTEDPNVGKVLIRAEFESLDGQNWLVPLVNLANTHVMDQLKAFYDEAPAALPTKERLVEVFESEAEKANKKAEALAGEQRQRREQIRPTGKQVRVFTDESGDIGFNSTHGVYAYANIIVPEERYEGLKTELRGMLAKHWTNTRPKEIHLTKIQEPKKSAVREDLANALLGHDVQIVCCIVEKWAFLKHLFREHSEARVREEMPLNITWEELVKEKEYRLQFNFLADTVEDVVSHLAEKFAQQGTVAAYSHDRKHRDWMNEALEHGFKRGLETARRNSQAQFGAVIVPPATFNLQHSEAEPCLWLADWISNELRAWCFHEDLSPAFLKAKPNMTFMGFGPEGVRHTSKELGGHGERSFNDSAREIKKSDPSKPPPQA